MMHSTALNYGKRMAPLPAPCWSAISLKALQVHIFLSKNNAVYFLDGSNITTSVFNLNTQDNNYSIYKTNGTKNSLQKITPDYRSIQSFTVTDNGLVFYVSFNYNTYKYELW